MVNKPPAFQFYAGDFDQGTAEMTAEQTGCYIRWLCHQWVAGSIPLDPLQLAGLTRITSEIFARVWPAVGPKFQPAEDGRLRNARLESEREKQREWRAELSGSGKEGAKARWQDKELADPKPDGEANGGASGEASGGTHGEKMPLHSSVFTLPPPGSGPLRRPAGPRRFPGATLEVSPSRHPARCARAKLPYAAFCKNFTGESAPLAQSRAPLIRL